MGQIIHPIAESPNESLITNATPGAGGGQSGELIFNADSAALEMLYKKKLSSGFVHFPSRERLNFNSAAASSGAKISGYFPTSPLTATNVQDALDQLAGLISSLGAAGGGNLGGSLTTGKFPKASAANTLVDSILSEASGKILFNGDTVANLYRYTTGYLQTDGGFGVTGQFDANGLVNLTQLITACGAYTFSNTSVNNALSFLINPVLNKNNANVRAFSALMISPTLQAGGSNNFTTLNVLNIDPSVTTDTGLLTNLIRLGYNGTDLWAINSVGDLVLTGSGQTFRRANDTSHTFLCGGSATSSSNGAMIFLSGVNDSTWAGKLRLYSGVGAAIEFYGPTYFSDFETIKQRSSTPSAPTDGTTLNRYMKGSKFVLQYNDLGTIRYKYIDLANTGATWTDSTTAP